MKIIVTGGSGLVGSAIRSIQDEYPQYELITPSSEHCNLLDNLDVDELLYTHRPDWVIHLAANVGGLYKNMNYPVQMFEENILMNMNILRSCHDHGVKNFIGCLSTCIFPDDITYPINETQLHDGAPHSSNAAYAYAKRMLQVQCEAYNNMYDYNYNCIIPTNIYGDQDNYNLENSHVIPGLIHRCYLAKQQNEPFVVRGTGNVLRQFIHASDLAHSILQLLPKLYKDVIIIAGDGEEVTIKDVAIMIAEQFDYVDKMQFDNTFSVGQYKKTADVTKYKAYLPDYKFMNIKQGIAETVEYFKTNYANCRK